MASQARLIALSEHTFHGVGAIRPNLYGYAHMRVAHQPRDVAHHVTWIQHTPAVGHQPVVALYEGGVPHPWAAVVVHVDGGGSSRPETAGTQLQVENLASYWEGWVGELYHARVRNVAARIQVFRIRA